jgi:5-methyltetrahydrofolate--homocysteine methyltransferase
MLRSFIANDVPYIHAVVGFYEAQSESDTIFIADRPFPMLRQQRKNEKDEYLCLSYFIAPVESGKKDYIGAFAVTAGAGAESQLKKYENEGDEYAALLMKSLLDRLAEAATEWLHAKVRREFWGYAADESLTVAEMFAVKYRGIRPAVGYPSIPDQSVNFALHEMLHSEEIGISLSENGVMYPNASVSGLFFAHPQAKYFAVGEISEEQLSDYARRKGRNTDDIRKFLLANLHLENQ